MVGELWLGVSKLTVDVENSETETDNELVSIPRVVVDP